MTALADATTTAAAAPATPQLPGTSGAGARSARESNALAQAAEGAPARTAARSASAPAAASATSGSNAPAAAAVSAGASPAGSGAKRVALPWVSSATQPYTVTQLNAFTKTTLEETFGAVWVEGEIAELKLTAQNHLFFRVKDANAQIDARMWNSYRTRLKFRPENGMKVLIHGRLEFYEKRGQVSLGAWRIEPTGVGALLVALEQLKKKLATEGLFDRPKRPLPEFPAVIGLVTSPTGAALRDMLAVLRKRWPVARVVIAPAVVQGDGAPASLVKALDRLYRLGQCDVIVVGRGGGSAEDLAAFNAETVVRAVARSPAPIVSAVGHEVDVSLTDFAADHRAPTPTAAAQSIVPDRRDLIRYVRQRAEDLELLAVRRLSAAAGRVADLTRDLFRARPAGRLKAQAQAWVDFDDAIRVGARERLLGAVQTWRGLEQRIDARTLRLQLAAAAARHDGLAERFAREAVQLPLRQGARVERLADRLNALSPLNVLARGYSVTHAVEPDGTTGAVVRNRAQARAAQRLRTRLTDGSVDSQVTDEPPEA
ncbi:MAG: exodeoxyribonuclease VII large subunit [Planctomycetota bacterium]